MIEPSADFLEGMQLAPRDPPGETGGTSRPSAGQELNVRFMTLAELQRQHILAVLERVGGNRSRASEVLGIPRRTLYRRLEEYGILGEE